jgi:type I restriction enzyme, S subunit
MLKDTKTGFIVQDWETIPLGVAFEKVKRKNSDGISLVLTASGQYGLIDQREYFNRSVAGKSLSNYYLLKKGDFAYNRSFMNGYPYGAIKRLTSYEQGIVSILYICFSLNHKECNADFYAYYFDSGYLNCQLQSIVKIGARAHGLINIKVDDFYKMVLPKPPLSEQRKITEILSAIDKAIEKTGDIIQKTQQLKKGLMQKLFTEGIGHTRFKETKIGRIPEDWEVRTLGTISRFQNGYAFNSSHYTDDPDNLVVIRMSNITKYGALDISVDRIKYFPYSKLALVEQFLLKKRDLIIAMTDMSREMRIIGHTAIIDSDGKYLLNQRVGKIIPDESVVDKSYLHTYTNTDTFIMYIKSTSAGAVQVNANTSDIKKAIIPLPKLLEQRKIAEIISEVDAKIKTEQAYKTELEQLKKGLMQRLLTGKVRVKV